MENPTGRVVSVHNDAPPTRVLLDVESGVACARCAAGNGCGAGLLGQQPRDRQIEASLEHEMALSPGDTVSIALHPSNVLQAAIVVYGYPLLSAVGAVLLAWNLNFSDVAASFCALAGIVGGVMLARRRLKNSRCLRRFTPVIVARLSGASR